MDCFQQAEGITFVWIMALVGVAMVTWHGYMFYRDVKDFLIEAERKLDVLIEAFK